MMVLGLTTYAQAATELKYQNDETNNTQTVQGSDGRLNVSARVDSRIFYVSRDQEQAYVLRIEDDDAAANDLVAYLRNDSKDKLLYITDIHFNAENASTWKLAFGDATTATGTTVTPVNLNRSSSNDADVTALGNAAVGGVTASTFFSSARIGADDLVEYDTKDALILGQNDNLVVEYDTGTTGDIEVDIFFFIE